MAKMWPSSLDGVTINATEREIYYKLKAALKDKEDWHVLYSVGLVKHVTQIKGEIDFLICAPGQGIFVLEVKGSNDISVDENGTWTFHYVNEGDKKGKSPFDQARQGLESLMMYLKEKVPFIDNIRRGYGVMFTKVKCRFNAPDVDREIIFDFDDVNRYSAKGWGHGKDVEEYLSRLMSYYAKHSPGNINTPPSAEAVKNIVHALKSDYKFSALLKNKIAARIDKTDYDCNGDALEGLLSNERWLIRGAGGSGKTVLAEKYARHFAERGLRVGVFCYNVPLAKKLRQDLAGCGDVYADSLTEWMRETALKEGLITQAYYDAVSAESKTRLNNFYREELPPMITEWMRGNDEFQKFDVLVCDEAQDLMDIEFITVMDNMLKGGLENGRYALFGDFDKQVLYNTIDGEEDVWDILDICGKRGSKPLVYTLPYNCRNPIKVQKELQKLFGAEGKPAPALADMDGEVQYHKCKDDDDEREKIQKVLDELIDGEDRIDSKHIVVLAPHTLKNSVVSRVERHKIVVFDPKTTYNPKEKAVEFSTIYRFKGFGRPVVLLTGITEEEEDNLIYTGMSRAEYLLHVFYRKGSMIDKKRSGKEDRESGRECGA